MDMTTDKFDPKAALTDARYEQGAFRTSPIQGSPPTPRPLGPAHPLQPHNAYDLPVSTVRAWTIGDVRTAIDLTASGFFEQAADLALYMRRDSTFAACMDKRVLGLLRCAFKVEPASQSDIDLEVAKAVERFWERMAPEKELRKWVEWYHLLSFAPASIDWEFEPEEDRVWHLPILRHRHPRWFYFNVGTWCWIDIHSTGQNAVDEQDGRYCIADEWSYGEFAGKVANMGEDWIEKVFARRDWADWSDYYAWPVFKAMVPAMEPNEDGTPTVGEQFAASLQGQVRNRTVMCQKDKEGTNTYDVEPLNMSKEEHKGFLDRIAMLDRKMCIAWLGNNLGTEMAEGGSYAAAETQQGAEIRLIMADNVFLGQVLRDRLVRAFVTENFGHDVACPNVGWRIDEESEMKTVAEGLRFFATFLKDIPLQYEIRNLMSIGERFGVEIVKGESSDELPAVAKKAPESETRAALIIHRTIKKVGTSKWRLYSGSGKNLGTFSSLAAAKKHEKQVNYFKDREGRDPTADEMKDECRCRECK